MFGWESCRPDQFSENIVAKGPLRRAQRTTAHFTFLQIAHLVITVIESEVGWR